MIKTIRTMNEHQRHAVFYAAILAMCLGLVVGFAAKSLIDRIDSKDKAMAWFHSIPQTERNDFVYTQLLSATQQHYIATQWCRINWKTTWACRHARMANPIKAEDVK